MNRDRMTFPFLAFTVDSKAIAKRDHHLARLAFYKAEADAAERDLRENGIRYTPEDSNRTRTTYGGDVEMDYAKQERLRKARSKVGEHTDTVNRLAALIVGLESLLEHGDENPIVQLDTDDIQWLGISETTA